MSEVKRYNWHEDGMYSPELNGRFVRSQDFDRVTAELDAALLAVDRLGGTIEKLSTEILDRNQRLTESHQREARLQDMVAAADERADVLETALSRIQFGCQTFVKSDWRMAVESVEAILGIADAALKPADGHGDK